MEYKKGIITLKQGTIFKNTGQRDPRRNGHPIMLPFASDDLNMNTYYLMIDSHPENYVKFGDAYYIIEDWEEVHLLMPSVVNVRDIYKGHINGIVKGGFPPKSYKRVIAALKAYQEKHPDEYYDEIKAKL